MNKIYTSLEQSKKLVELGIDVNTAYMYYQYYKSYSPSEGITEGHCDIPVIGSWKEHHISIPDPAMPNADIPAWSLNSLLNIIKNGKDCNGVELCANYASKWVLTTTYYNSVWKEKEIIAEDSIDAAFQMVVWLKENGKI